VAVEGGYRVSGRWAFASGCRHATWLWVNCELYDGDSPRLGADGKTLGRFMFLPRAGVEIVDTWHASGMRGTGSHDIVADDVFVPEEHSMSAQEPLCRPEPLYALGAGWPLMHLAAAAVPLGIARHAIDALVEVASTKTPHLGGGLLAERPITQARVGQAEAHLRAGRAFLFEIVRETWQAVCQIGALTAEQRAPVRLAAVEATSLAVQATELMHRAAGSTAILSSSPLDRCWRDIQAASRNIGINEDHFTAVGRSFLSLDP
jgi:alkylation response protein AidB-like acyl-CoA dehydrogenase